MKLTIELDEEVVDLLDNLMDDEEAPCLVCPHCDPRIGCVGCGDDCYCLKIKEAIKDARQKRLHNT